ncbi:sialic acid-binding Ig-like lectin 9 [Colossoma macropomum]|uniref:sialic acid-binding Ig-like lectin 9 n=1 Tax=Colossoma macropomum TaxID=42526 RepID=UPI001863F2D0|nr:sialic acid-binding Ig-like lectin 9 [Colossoma macropomum]
MWFKDGTEQNHIVFDSTTPKDNKIKGKITGDLRMKNCTTIFNSVNKSHSGRYYFRISESGELKYTYTTASVYINVSDSPPKPTLSLYGDQMEVQDRRVLEGSSVSLFCSAFSLCPSVLPTLSWSPLPTNISQEQNQNTSFISSQLNFITTHLHHRLRFNCTATYQLENNDTKTTQRSLVLRVLYPLRTHLYQCLHLVQ